MKLFSKIALGSIVLAQFFWSCKTEDNSQAMDSNFITVSAEENFPVMVEQFADLKVLRYQIPGWENLTLKEQKLVYYLTKAGLSGRDIMWDQNYRHNLTIRKALESVYANFGGDKSTAEWAAFEVYLKRVWFSNGIHHHYSNAKMKPDFSSKYLTSILTASNTVLEGEAFEVIFNDKDAKKVNQAKRCR